MKFIDPPNTRSIGRTAPRYITDEIQEELRNHQGEWALYAESAHRRVRGAVANWCQRHRDFESTSRVAGMDDGGPVFDIYVRYVGE